MPSITPLSCTAAMTSSVMSLTERPPLVRSCRSCWKTFTVRSPSSSVDGSQERAAAYFEGSRRLSHAEPSVAAIVRFGGLRGGLGGRLATLAEDDRVLHALALELEGVVDVAPVHALEDVVAGLLDGDPARAELELGLDDRERLQ